ncbi:MAG: hypothetical protein CMJ38_00475 [Phycisphaerae bacterium]|nr:hypothetical protein [Phycisphaerae bacterium]
MESDLRSSKKQNVLDTVPKDTAKKMCFTFLKKNMTRAQLNDVVLPMCDEFFKKKMSPAKISDIVLPKSRNNKTKKSVSPKKNTRSNEIRSYNSNNSYFDNIPLVDVVKAMNKRKTNKTKKSVSPQKKTNIRNQEKERLQKALNNYTPEIRSMKNINMNDPNLFIRNGSKGLSPNNINNNEWNEQGFGIVKNKTRKSTKRPQLMSKRNIAKRMKNPCPPGMVRSEKTGYCRKEEYAKKSYDKKTPCKDGKVRHHKTGYCRKPKNMNMSYKKKHSQQKTRNKNVTKKVKISNENVNIHVENVGPRSETPNNYIPMQEQPKIISSPSNVSNNEWDRYIPPKYKDLINN